jgi:hypothetical protein
MKQILHINRIKTGIIILWALFFFSSCQKEITVDDGGGGGGGGTGTNQKPKVGTVWTYRYYIYNPPVAGGGVHTTEIVKYKAKEELVLGGEKWLNVVNVATDTTIFLLSAKTGGLYQYANNSSNLFCKDPAAIGDTYTSFNDRGVENFTVKGVKDTLQTGIGDIPANYYEGVKVAKLIDMLWYNEYAWIVRRTFYLYDPIPVPVPTYYKYSTLFLDKIEY